jgi:hypothetical protein
MLSPWRAVSSTLFTTLYGITSRSDDRYPCAAPALSAQAEAALRSAFGAVPGVRANDGVVPVLSQVWGEVIWAGSADHLDVLGHFPSSAVDTRRSLVSRLVDRVRGVGRDVRAEAAASHAAQTGGVAPRPDADARHVDWLTSGAGFDEKAFASVMDRVANGMMRASDPRPGG